MALLPRHKARRLYDPAKPVYARRELTIGKKTYRVGERVPLADLDVALPTAQMWYRVRFISHDPPESPTPSKIVQKVEPKAQPADETIRMPGVASKPMAEHLERETTAKKQRR